MCSALLRVLLLSMQCINTFFLVLPSVYILARQCAWFDALVYWSIVVCWQVRAFLQ